MPMPRELMTDDDGSAFVVMSTFCIVPCVASPDATYNISIPSLYFCLSSPPLFTPSPFPPRLPVSSTATKEARGELMEYLTLMETNCCREVRSCISVTALQSNQTKKRRRRRRRMRRRRRRRRRREFRYRTKHLNHFVFGELWRILIALIKLRAARAWIDVPDVQISTRRRWRRWRRWRTWRTWRR